MSYCSEVLHQHGISHNAINSASVGSAFQQSIALMQDFIRQIDNNNANDDQQKSVSTPTGSSVITSTQVCRIPGRRGLAIGAATKTSSTASNTNTNSNTKQQEQENIYGIFQPSGSPIREEFHIPGLLARKCHPLNLSCKKEKNDADNDDVVVAFIETDAEERFLLVEKRKDVVTVKRVVLSSSAKTDSSERHNNLNKELFMNCDDDGDQDANSILLIGGCFPNDIMFVTRKGVYIFEADDVDDDDEEEDQDIFKVKLKKLEEEKLSDNNNNDNDEEGALRNAPLILNNNKIAGQDESSSSSPSQVVIAAVSTQNKSTIVLLVGSGCSSSLYILDDETLPSSSFTLQEVTYQDVNTKLVSDFLLGGCGGYGVACMTVEQIEVEQQLDAETEQKQKLRKLFILLSEPEFYDDQDQENTVGGGVGDEHKRMFYRPSGIIEVNILASSDTSRPPIVHRVAALKTLPAHRHHQQQQKQETDNNNNDDPSQETDHADIPSAAKDSSATRKSTSFFKKSLLESSSVIRPVIVLRPMKHINNHHIDEDPDDTFRPSIGAIFVDTYFYDGKSNLLLFSCRPFPLQHDSELNQEACKIVIRQGPTNVPFTLPDFTDPNFFLPFCCTKGNHHNSVNSSSIISIDYFGNATGIGASGDWRNDNNNMNNSNNQHQRQPISISTWNFSVPYFDTSLFSRVLRSVENFNHSHLWICETEGGVSLGKIMTNNSSSSSNDNQQQLLLKTEDMVSSISLLSSVSSSGHYYDQTQQPIFNRICSIASLMSHGKNISLRNYCPHRMSEQQKKKTEERRRLSSNDGMKNDDNDDNDDGRNTSMSSNFMTPSSSKMMMGAANTHTNSGSPESLLGVVSGALLSPSSSLSQQHQQQEYGAVVVDFSSVNNIDDDNNDDTSTSITSSPRVVSNAISLGYNRPNCTLCLRGHNNNNTDVDDVLLFVAGCASNTVMFSLLTKQQEQQGDAAPSFHYSSSRETTSFSLLLHDNENNKNNNHYPIIAIFTASPSTAPTRTGLPTNSTTSSNNSSGHHNHHHQRIFILQRDGTLSCLRVSSSGNILVQQEFTKNIFEQSTLPSSSSSTEQIQQKYLITSCSFEYNKKLNSSFLTTSSSSMNDSSNANVLYSYVVKQQRGPGRGTNQNTPEPRQVYLEEIL